jgi:hypothetical protein
MQRLSIYLGAVIVAASVTGVCLLQSERFNADTSPGSQRPDGWLPAGGDPGPFPSEGFIQPNVVNMASLPLASEDPRLDLLEPRRGDGGPEMPISKAEADALRLVAMRLPPQPRVQVMDTLDVANRAPDIDRSFDAINFDDGGFSVPPDPEMAVGPNHVIATVNSLIEIYDRDGNTLLGPVASDSFFSGTAGCFGTFDPNVLYDEKEDRFFIGYDSGGGPGTDNGYCMAATQTNDPTGAWNLYSFDASFNPGDFFDYPHAGVGDTAIFMGGNVFGDTFHADVWAIDKFAMYNGQALAMPVRHQLNETGNDPDTPQPMNAHGFLNGSWPEGDVHYTIAECSFNGTSMCVYRWEDPFGADLFSLVGSVDLNIETGVNGGFPLDQPQDGPTVLQGNDWRPQDAEYRNGVITMTQTISCNPGAGPVNCVRWAQIDPLTASFVDGGVIGSDGDFRSFPDAAVNDCGDLTLGYTKTNSTMFPGVYFTGRLLDDPPGLLQPEAELKAGEVAYQSFQGSGSPNRWGDYTGATSDFDGGLNWYLGQYSRDNAAQTKWGNIIGATDSGCVPDLVLPEVFLIDGFEFS